jgi:peptidoglycan/LPS O-acetylase OafA/YrhL
VWYVPVMHRDANSARTMERLSELDVLRLAAAGSVALYHLTDQPVAADPAYQALSAVAEFGFLGVPLFFMISGFVILWSASTKTALGFATARMARLYPAFWVCVLITSGVILATDMDNRIDAHTLVANLTMLAGFFHVPYIDYVYWTLTAELKFYGLVALVLVARQVPRVEFWLAAWVCAAAIVAGSDGLRWLKVLTLHPWGAFFASGCVYYLIWSRGISATRLALASVAAVLCVHNAAFAQADFTGIGTSWARGVTAATILTMQLTFLALVTTPLRLPESRAWYWLGALTYPLYLLHNELGDRLWKALPQTVGPWSRLGVTIAVMLLISALVAYFVEHRTCKAARRYLERRLVARFSPANPNRR